MPASFVLTLVFVPVSAHGQIFQLEGGTSSLYQAHGGSVGFRTSTSDGWVGLGSLDGFRFGAFVRTKVGDSTLTFGDDAIPFRLGTDVFDTSHYFMGRGVGLMQMRGTTRIFGFAGATSRGVGTPYFQAADADKGMGLLFLDRPITPTLSFYSRTLISSRETTINGLDWQPRSGLRTSLAGGVGANQPYSAASLTFDREWVSVKAAYIYAGDQFRRIAVQQPLTSEVDRENILLTLRPTSSLTLSAGRQNFLQPLPQGQTGFRGTVNQYAATFSAARFNLSGVLFDSQALGFGSRGTSFSLGRDILNRVQVNGNYLRSRAGSSRPLSSLLGTFRETISPRLSLLQVVNYSQGRSTVSFGGNLVSNRISIGIEYQTLYLPFRTGNQFKQALVLNFQLRPFGNVQLNAGSYIAPDGTVKYTAYGGTFLYRGTLAGHPGATNVGFHKYIIRGRVVDETGNPIRGAALRIDGEVAFSDSNGDFFVRMRKAAVYKMEVLLDQFIIPGKFEVASAPDAVRAEPEGVARELTIVVRRTAPSSRRLSESANPPSSIQ